MVLVLCALWPVQTCLASPSGSRLTGRASRHRFVLHFIKLEFKYIHCVQHVTTTVATVKGTNSTFDWAPPGWGRVSQVVILIC